MQKAAEEQSYIEHQIEIENQRIKSEIEELETLIKTEGGNLDEDNSLDTEKSVYTFNLKLSEYEIIEDGKKVYNCPRSDCNSILKTKGRLR